MEENHCYENAKAERLNGILRQEYGLGETFVSKGEVPGAMREAVGLYNDFRPHGALANCVPMAAHRAGTAWGVPGFEAKPRSLAPPTRQEQVTTLDQDWTKIAGGVQTRRGKLMGGRRELAFDGDAHGAGLAGEDSGGCVFVEAVEVFDLGLGGFAELGHGD